MLATSLSCPSLVQPAIANNTSELPISEKSAYVAAWPIASAGLYLYAAQSGTQLNRHKAA
jgi:hypothetical protein